MFKKYTVPALIFLCLSAPMPAPPVDAAGAAGAEGTVSTEEEETGEALDTVTAESPEARPGFTVWANLRPILTYLRVEGRAGSEISEEDLRVRARLGVRKSLLTTLWVGAGIAGRCFTDKCDPEFVMQSETPSVSRPRLDEVNTRSPDHLRYNTNVKGPGFLSSSGRYRSGRGGGISIGLLRRAQSGPCLGMRDCPLCSAL